MYLTTQDRIKIAIFPSRLPPMYFQTPSVVPAVCFCHRGVSAERAQQVLLERGWSSSPVPGCWFWEWSPRAQDGWDSQTANAHPAETAQPCSPLCRYSINERQFLRLGFLSWLFEAVKTALMHCINLAQGWLEAVRVVCHLSKQHQASKWEKQYKVEIL